MILVENLSKRFGERTAVESLSFALEHGELLAVVGGSGSGKTTTLKLLNRLIEPTSGRISIDGADLSTLEPHLLRRRIGYVFQKIGLFSHLNVRENIEITPSLLGWSPERRHARSRELLQLMELDPLIEAQYPSELSGGQAQRVAIARALAAEPQMMLLDEPFSAIDALTRDRLQRWFSDLRRKLRLTSVFVTHDLTEALLMADRILVMHDGKRVQLGTPEELLRSPADDYVSELFETPRQKLRELSRAFGEVQS